MFDVYCPHCEAVVLLTPRRIRGLTNTDRGIALGYRCWCGYEGWLVGGRRLGRREERAATAA